MGKAVLALLAGAYLSISLTIAALFWRAGAGWGVGSAVMIGMLALTFTLHNLIGRAVQTASLRRELEVLRDAHRILADQLEETDAALQMLSETLETQAAERTEALTSEVRMLEDLVE